MTCSICFSETEGHVRELADVSRATVWVSQTTPVRLPCPGGHTYHKECILEWLKRNQSCPLCRARIRDGGGVGGATPNYNRAYNQSVFDESGYFRDTHSNQLLLDDVAWLACYGLCDCLINSTMTSCTCDACCAPIVQSAEAIAGCVATACGCAFKAIKNCICGGGEKKVSASSTESCAHYSNGQCNTTALNSAASSHHGANGVLQQGVAASHGSIQASHGSIQTSAVANTVHLPHVALGAASLHTALLPASCACIGGIGCVCTAMSAKRNRKSSGPSL